MMQSPEKNYFLKDTKCIGEIKLYIFLDFNILKRINLLFIFDLVILLKAKVETSRLICILDV